MVATQKDPDTAFLIELIGGMFGFLGLGYIYVGRTNDGIIRLGIFLVYNIVAWIAIALLTLVAIGCFCMPVQLIIQAGVAVFSAFQLKNKLTMGMPIPATITADVPPVPPQPAPQPSYVSPSPAPSVPLPTFPPPAPMASSDLRQAEPLSSRDWPPPAPLPREDAPIVPTPPPSEDVTTSASTPPAEDMPAQPAPPPETDNPAEPTP